MESISMDLKVMPTSFHGYNYLLVMRCNHSCFIISDMLKTRKASEIAESLFQKLICAHVTNIKEIYCDLHTAFKNEIVSTLFKTWVSQSSFIAFIHIIATQLKVPYKTLLYTILPNMVTFVEYGHVLLEYFAHKSLAKYQQL